MDRTVFRLRQLPSHIDKLDTLSLLSKALGVEASTIRIISLASSVNPWLPRKEATLMFVGDVIKIQKILEEEARPGITRCGDEWVIEAASLSDNWILDSHFRGLTALYDPPLHTADCIAISGLASHPFGSWQPKGQSKSFMWIRDALPKSMPNLRPILYGYDSTLVKSHSIQSTFDLALALISQLKANGWVSPTCKPLAFLAHSLGGIILKQALVSLAGSNDHDDPIFHVMKGAVFFGVPNLGMEQSHLKAVVEGQANTGLIEALSPKSTDLHQLDAQFNGISNLQNSLLYWCYETMESPTVALGPDGKWSRMGPEEILVTPDSATRGFYGDPTKQDFIFPIDKDHSGIVKFSENDPSYYVIVRQLKQIFSRDSVKGTGALEPTNLTTGLARKLPELAEKLQSTLNEDNILTSLHAPELDRRLEEIETQFKDTFNWVYDLPQPGFSRWLQNDSGLFWIRGKPGSGKSTLMKFIFRDRRTSDLLSDWRGEKSYIRAAFFFHHRGTSLQKSFEGLLRSIISQIISQKPSLCKFIQPIYNKSDFSSDYWTLQMLQRGLGEILRQEEVPIHLCLFFDALDEYDGPLEFLCRFLVDLGAIVPKPNKRIKVCFSSRPWDIFMNAFRNCAGFQIHDFTTDDITDYCLSSIQEENLSSAALRSLIPDIVTRSRGVFLWVKLLIKDLARNKRNISNIEIKGFLQSYPTELDSFYTRIIQRISRIHRRKTYVILESIVRSKETITPLRLMGIIDCSDCKTYAEAEEMVWKAHNCSEEHLVNAIIRYSKDYCGGLVEIRRGFGGLYVQVLHQTVEDFVKDPKFKKLVLEEQSKIMGENGHTFLAKYFCLRGSVDNFTDKFPISPSSPDIYACQSEGTTGLSLKPFIDSIPREKIIRLAENNEIDTPLALATFFHCRLYIIESLADSPTLLQECEKPLLSYAIPIIMFEERSESAASMVKLLLENGVPPALDPVPFQRLISNLCSGPRAGNWFHINMVEMLLKYGQNPDMKLKNDLEAAALHFPRLQKRMVQILLENGATANVLDIRGRTPLDWLCEEESEDSPRGRDSKLLFETYQKACLLVSHGGVVTKGGVKYSKRLLRIFQDEGFPIDDLQACFSRPGKIPRVSLEFRAKKAKFYVIQALTDKESQVRTLDLAR